MQPGQCQIGSSGKAVAAYPVSATSSAGLINARLCLRSDHQPAIHEFVAVHAMAVVDDGRHRLLAIVNVELDIPRVCIERVLPQL